VGGDRAFATSAAQTAEKLVTVVEARKPEQTGLLFDHTSKPIPF
jgi:hypothetical protein